MKAIRKLIIALCTLQACLICALLMPTLARADAVTDNLSVAVGYSGMALSDYVIVGTYHWSELEANLPIYEQAYSFYQSGSGTDYVAIVDSARGFGVSDLLDYAGVYYGDVYNLQFYVTDHNGIQAALDRDTLFAQRYYFDDLPFHLERYYNEDTGRLTGYGYDEAWNYAYSVQPMLALEDNWVAFSQEFEHIGPNFESMSASNRFRLLFGQSSPTETMTSASAKYVSCIYVTLYGAPEIGDMPELDNSLGSHEVTARVRVDNPDLRNALSEYMRLSSTDENVLRIKGMTVTPVAGYSDLADVRISYEIVGEGNASITANFGGSTAAQQLSKPVEVTSGNDQTDPDPQGNETAEDPGSDSHDPAGQIRPHRPRGDPVVPGHLTPVIDTVPPNTPLPSETAGQNQAANKTDTVLPAETAKDTQGAAAETGVQIDPNIDKRENKTVEQTTEIIETDPAEAVLAQNETDRQAGGGAYSLRLSGEAEEELEELRSQSAIASLQQDVPATEDITQVKVTITDNDRKILLWTGVACAVLCLLGAGSEIMSFRFRLKRSRIRSA